MLRKLSLAVACVAAMGLIVPASLSADPAPRAEAVKAKPPHGARRPVGRHPGRYGFLPGYEPPPVDRLGSPVYGTEAAHAYGWGGRYWYRGRWYYGWGGPGYYRGRWNGGGFGPCYTQTPIGPMWNCGH